MDLEGSCAYLGYLESNLESTAAGSEKFFHLNFRLDDPV